MRSLLKSMFETNNATAATQVQIAKDDDFFEDKPAALLPAGKRPRGIEVVELSFDEYVRLMKQEERILS